MLIPIDKQFQSDLLLARACAQGDEQAMDAVYRGYGPKILSICRRYAASHDEALDLLHDGFVRVFEKIDSYRAECPLEAWVKRVVVNHSINVLKAKVKWEELDTDEFPDDSDEAPEEDLGPADTERLLDLIRCLPPGYKMVLNLYVFEGMSHDAIAERLQISAVSSRTQLFKARKLLKKQWKK